MTSSIVEVVLHLPSIGRTIRPVQLRVQIEDTSEADARAVVVSRLVLDLPSINLSSALTLRFELPPSVDAGGLTVSAIVAADTSRPPMPGDLITPASVPIVPGEAAHIYLAEYRDR